MLCERVAVVVYIARDRCDPNFIFCVPNLRYYFVTYRIYMYVHILWTCLDIIHEKRDFPPADFPVPLAISLLHPLPVNRFTRSPE